MVMTLSKTKPDEQGPDYFRCPINNGRTDATIRIGRKRVKATVQETSIDGYTVVVGPSHSSKLAVGKSWLLEHDGTKTEVHPLWFFNTPEGDVQLGLKRLRDLTPPEKHSRSLLVRFGGARFQDPSYSAAVYGGFVLSLICLMALPGWGDHMGTSDRIHDVVHWFIDGLDDTLGKYL